MKKCFILSCTVAFFVTMIFYSYAGGIKADLKQNLIRLHVVANSDSEYDQALKLCVRDTVLNAAENLFNDCEDKVTAEKVIKQNIEHLTEVAKSEIKKQGYDYPVKIELTTTDFPTKEYKNIKLPKGEYLALRVLIGKASGQNWWCVLYPPLCFCEEVGKLSDNALKTLKDNLTDDEYEIITNNDNLAVKFKFKLLELF